MSQLKIMIVEDDATTAEALQSELEENLESVRVDIEPSFDTALERLVDEKDVSMLILDLYEGNLQRDNLAGQAIWNMVWEQRFIPVVIFSAGVVDLEPKPPENNPFVAVIKKGEKGPLEVVEYIETIQPHFRSLESVQTEVDKAIQVVLRDASPQIWFFAEGEETVRSAKLVRAVKRRLAAMIDVSALQEEGIKGWERYIYPPLENNLLTGDVLRLRIGNWTDPSVFRIVLSPSCDLVPRSDGKLKMSFSLKLRV